MQVRVSDEQHQPLTPLPTARSLGCMTPSHLDSARWGWSRRGSCAARTPRHFGLGDEGDCDGLDEHFEPATTQCVRSAQERGQEPKRWPWGMGCSEISSTSNASLSPMVSSTTVTIHETDATVLEAPKAVGQCCPERNSCTRRYSTGRPLPTSTPRGALRRTSKGDGTPAATGSTDVMTTRRSRAHS
eukprot:5817844-Amphidinium_carterae.1